MEHTHPFYHSPESSEKEHRLAWNFSQVPNTPPVGPEGLRELKPSKDKVDVPKVTKDTISSGTGDVAKNVKTSLGEGFKKLGTVLDKGMAALKGLGLDKAGKNDLTKTELPMTMGGTMDAPQGETVKQDDLSQKPMAEVGTLDAPVQKTDDMSQKPMAEGGTLDAPVQKTDDLSQKPMAEGGTLDAPVQKTDDLSQKPMAEGGTLDAPVQKTDDLSQKPMAEGGTLDAPVQKTDDLSQKPMA